MRYFKKFWHKKSSGKRRSVFGGQVASQSQVKALNQKIKNHEQQEFEAFENEFETKLKNL